ncbi:MAG TPA: dihydropteroate synthase [Polyangiaceae bacterium]|nr:dihydropteroate synthase [Polyangiaceae bacterium]
MGVCNVTPDSFSDGGRYLGANEACARVDELLAEGADLVDIGGESTRPGAAPVPPKDQLARVLDVVRYAADRGACVSIDTTSPEVAAACLDAGACAVNDVSCLRDDDLAKVVASSGAAIVIMHTRGTQAEMKGFSEYPDDAYGDDVLGTVIEEWRVAAGRARAAGLEDGAIWMDPGLGFAKNARQSMEILRHIGRLETSFPHGVVLGASRKSFLKLVDTSAAPDERLGASIAAAVHAGGNVDMLRVHDVRATAQAIDLTRLLQKGP